jgi:hypothetical protein
MPYAEARMSLGDEELGWTMTAGFGIATIALFRAYWLIGLFILADSAWTGSWVEGKKGASCSRRQRSRIDDLICNRSFCFHMYISNTSLSRGAQINIG